MSEYDNTNRGVLFKNDDKATDTHPDYNGSINVGGTDYWLSAWVKVSSKTGKKFFSMSVKPKEVKRAAPKSPEPDDPNDDIPF